MVYCKKAFVKHHSCSLFSNEIRRHAAEAHHDIPELWPSSLQTHEVSDNQMIIGRFGEILYLDCIKNLFRAARGWC